MPRVGQLDGIRGLAAVAVLEPTMAVAFAFALAAAVLPGSRGLLGRSPRAPSFCSESSRTASTSGTDTKGSEATKLPAPTPVPAS